MKKHWGIQMNQWRTRAWMLALLAGACFSASAQNAIQSINSSQQAGSEVVRIELSEPLAAIPPELADWHVTLQADGTELHYIFDATAERTGVPSLLRRMSDLGIGFKDLHTRQSSLEDIFVSLVTERGRG